MERKNAHWLTALIVAAFAVCSGFVAGSLLGIRERGQLKANNAALAQSQARTLERLTKEENKNGEASAELEIARTQIERWRLECERLRVGIATRVDRDLSFHPPMALDTDEFETQSRIVELECEVASLTERLNESRTVEGPPPDPPDSRTTLATATEPPTAKEQCSAITKKGARCSRPARSNGKCWQHGG